MLHLGRLLLICLLAGVHAQETSDYSKWINNRRSLRDGMPTYSTANCNCSLGVCTTWPPMCCANQGLCRTASQTSAAAVSFCCDHSTDANHCGQCGRKCSQGPCMAGQCVDLGKRLLLALHSFRTTDRYLLSIDTFTARTTLAPGEGYAHTHTLTSSRQCRQQFSRRQQEWQAWQTRVKPPGEAVTLHGQCRRRPSTEIHGHVFKGCNMNPKMRNCRNCYPAIDNKTRLSVAWSRLSCLLRGFHMMHQPTQGAVVLLLTQRTAILLAQF